MKLSLKVQDGHQDSQSDLLHGHRSHEKRPLLLRAKVPVTVFGLPFLSSIAAGDPSDLSFSLRTNFPSGPSLKLSYTPPSSTATGSAVANNPLILTLKSGVSLFGSPHNSPLVISAHLTLSPQNPNPTPTFSLQIKPQFGDFCLLKTIFSSQNPNPKANGEATSMGFVSLERPMDYSDKYSVFSGVSVAARTQLPLTKRLGMNFRWGVNIPSDIGKQLPFLTLHKVGIERFAGVEDMKEEVKNDEGKVNDLELLKGMFLSARRELEALQNDNRDLKQRMEALRSGSLRGQEWTYQRRGDSAAKKASPVTESSGEFEQWKTKKSGGQENGRKEPKKNAKHATDLESELQKAIQAAS